VLSVNIAELKARLSAYLLRVRAGEEILVRDRDLPVAKIVPLASSDVSAEELALAASGELSLPTRKLNARAFWSIGAGIPVTGDVAAAIARAVSEDREDRDAGLLGR
jgi:prevent-host-death family protein